MFSMESNNNSELQPYFYRHVENAVAIETAKHNHNLWKFEFDESSQKVQEISLFSFKGIGASFKHLWAKLTFNSDVEQNSKFATLVDRNVRVLSEQNPSIKDAYFLTPKFTTKQLKLALLAVKSKEEGIRQTIIKAIKDYVQNFEDGDGRLKASTKAILDDRAWQQLDPFELEDLDKRTRRTFFKVTLPEIRTKFPEVYKSAAELYSKIFNAYGGNPTAYGLIDHTEYHFTKSIYKENQLLIETLRNNFRTNLTDREANTLDSYFDAPELNSPPFPLLLKALEIAKANFPEFFHNNLDLKPDSYPLAIVAGILKQNPINGPFDKAILNKLSVDFNFTNKASNLRTSRNEALQRNDKELIDLYDKQLASLIHHYLGFDENPVASPVAVQTCVRALNLVIASFPELDLRIAPTPEKQRMVANILARALWNNNGAVHGVEEDIYFPILEARGLEENYETKFANQSSFVEHSLLSLQFTDRKDFENFQNLLSEIPYKQLENLGLVYLETPHYPHDLDNPDEKLDAQKAQLKKLKNREGSIKIGSEIFDIPVVKFKSGQIDSVKTPQETLIPIQSSFKKIIEFYNSNKENIDSLNLGEISVDQVKQYSSELESTSYHLPPNLGSLLEETAKFPPQLKKLLCIHLLTYIIYQKKLSQIVVEVPQFLRDAGASYQNYTLSDGAKIFNYDPKARTSLPSANNVKDNYFKFMASATPSDIDYIKKRALYWKKVSFIPENLSYENFKNYVPTEYTNKEVMDDFITALPLSANQMLAISRKTGLNYEQINGFYYQQILNIMLIVHQGLSAIQDKAPFYPKDGGGISDFVGTQELAMFPQKDDTPARKTGGDKLKLHLDESMSTLQAEGRVVIQLGKPEDPSDSSVPSLISYWKYVIPLAPGIGFQPKAMASKVDTEVKVSPYILQFISEGKFSFNKAP